MSQLYVKYGRDIHSSRDAAALAKHSQRATHNAVSCYNFTPLSDTNFELVTCGRTQYKLCEMTAQTYGASVLIRDKKYRCRKVVVRILCSYGGNSLCQKCSIYHDSTLMLCHIYYLSMWQ